MSQPQRFPLVQLGRVGGIPNLAPMLPITLVSPQHKIQADGLVDCGSTVSVLPYDLGVQLGLDWHKQQRYSLQLTGGLGRCSSARRGGRRDCQSLCSCAAVFCLGSIRQRAFDLGTRQFFPGV
jgi:hypothetical protein